MKKCETFQLTLSGFRQKVSTAKLLMSEAGTGINYIPVSCSGFDKEGDFCVRKQLENSILVTSARPSYLCSSIVYTTLLVCILISTVIYTFSWKHGLVKVFQAIGVKYIYFRMVWQEKKKLKVFAKICLTIWPLHSFLLEWRVCRRNCQNTDRTDCQLMWKGGYGGRRYRREKQHLARFLV